jgi:hypothetical protein
VSLRSIAPQQAKVFNIPRAGDVDIALSGTHLAQVEEFDDDGLDADGFESDQAAVRLSLYRTSAGGYVVATSGYRRHHWAVVLESSAQVLECLQDQDEYLGELQKLLLVEAGKRDAAIDAIARLDLRADNIKDLVRSVEGASKLIHTDHLADHVRRIEASIDTDPAQAIGSAKEMVESVAGNVLGYCKPDSGNFENLGQLVRAAFKCLNLSMDDIPDSAKGAEHLKRIFSGLNQIVEGTAELRNLYGTGHGRARKGGLNSRHARLVVGASATLCRFLLETLDARKVMNK